MSHLELAGGLRIVRRLLAEDVNNLERNAGWRSSSATLLRAVEVFLSSWPWLLNCSPLDGESLSQHNEKLRKEIAVSRTENAMLQQTIADRWHRIDELTEQNICLCHSQTAAGEKVRDLERQVEVLRNANERFTRRDPAEHNLVKAAEQLPAGTTVDIVRTEFGHSIQISRAHRTTVITAGYSPASDH
jgi:septal ring factor EnvC (AmiA/AmiB activator)